MFLSVIFLSVTFLMAAGGSQIERNITLDGTQSVPAAFGHG